MNINNFITLILAIYINVLFLFDVFIPIEISIAIAIFVLISLIRNAKKRKIGFINLLIFLIYAIPFIHIVPYLWLDLQADTPEVLWGLLSNEYNTNLQIVTLMASMGAVGALGFLFGNQVAQNGIKIEKNERCFNETTSGSMPLYLFYLWILVGIFFSYIFAPSSTIFEGRTTGYSLSAEWGFGSSWFFSYVIMLFALADSIFESRLSVRRHKFFLIICSSLYILIWLQLLRGDRESLPALVAGFIMILYGRIIFTNENKVNKKVLIKFYFIIFFILLISSFIVMFRSEVAGLDIEDALSEIFSYSSNYQIENIMHGTWSAVLLTPLSISGDYFYQLLPIEYGKTYFNLIASIIPGFIADWIGYMRPIDETRGPAYMMKFGQGGTHAVVVPFLNFRMIGIFVVVVIWSYFLSKAEVFCLTRPNTPKLAFIGSLIAIAPHWLWYGEKIAISGLIVWGLLYLCYKTLVDTFGKKDCGREYEC
jgi:hypothetical protein